MRRANAVPVFRHVLDHEQCSRTDLKVATGLASGTISAIVTELVARGLVVEHGETLATGGRPQRMLSVAPGRVLGACARVRPGEVDVQLVDLRGRVVWSRSAGHHGSTAGVGALVQVLAGLLDEAWSRAAESAGAWFAGSVVAMLGPVAEESRVVVALGLPIRDLDLRAALAASLEHPHPVRVFNDGRLGALAEYAALLLPDGGGRPRTMAYVESAWDGVSGGIVDAGRVMAGEHGLAGEVGHIVVDSRGEPCECGARGCLATVVPTALLARRSGVVGATVGDDGTNAFLAALHAGHPRARAVVAEAGQALAAAVATLSNLVDIGLVVLGGDLVKLYPWLSPAVTDVIANRARISPVFNPVVRVGTLGGTAVARGAWQTLESAVCADPLAVPVQGEPRV